MDGNVQSCGVDEEGVDVNSEEDWSNCGVDHTGMQSVHGMSRQTTVPLQVEFVSGMVTGEAVWAM